MKKTFVRRITQAVLLGGFPFHQCSLFLPHCLSIYYIPITLIYIVHGLGKSCTCKCIFDSFSTPKMLSKCEVCYSLKLVLTLMKVIHRTKAVTQHLFDGFFLLIKFQQNKTAAVKCSLCIIVCVSLCANFMSNVRYVLLCVCFFMF